MITITYTALFIFITAVWILLRVIFAVKNKTVDIKNELKLLTVYICIVVIARFVYFPMGLENGHIKPLIFDASRILPIWFNLVPIVHLFDVYDGWIVNILGNIAMFIPVGIVWPICFKKLNTLGKSILAGGCFSLFIEIAQLLFFDRCSDVDDLILNTTGVVIGALIYFGIKKLRKKRLPKAIV